MGSRREEIRLEDSKAGAGAMTVASRMKFEKLKVESDDLVLRAREKQVRAFGDGGLVVISVQISLHVCAVRVLGGTGQHEPFPGQAVFLWASPGGVDRQSGWRVSAHGRHEPKLSPRSPPLRILPR